MNAACLNTSKLQMIEALSSSTSVLFSPKNEPYFLSSTVQGFTQILHSLFLDIQKLEMWWYHLQLRLEFSAILQVV